MNTEQIEKLDRLMGQLEDIQDKAQEQVNEIMEMKKTLEQIKVQFDTGKMECKSDSIKNAKAVCLNQAGEVLNPNNIPQL